MISSMLQYIQKSPDCFHAVENLRQRLLSEGYTQLTAGEWTLTPGGKYFVRRNGSSTIAFRVPETLTGGFMMAAAHSDSPTFKLKERAERITGVPAPLPVSDRVVARVISRDGELLDTIRQTDNRSGI